MGFKDRLFTALQDLLSSKKVLMAIATLIATSLAKRNILLSPDDVTQILVIAASTIGAQGLADFRKSAAVIAAATPLAPPDKVEQTVNIEAAK